MILPKDLAIRSSSLHVSRRWFDWDPRVTKRDGKPAITGSKHVYVAAEIPVVLVKDVAGLGNKGSVVSVKRGYARNVLIPNGDAVYGTVWENIDAFSDPDAAKKEKINNRSKSVQQAVPFDWLSEVRLEFLRDTLPSNTSKLVEPVTVWQVLEALSVQEHIDILPSQLEFPEGGIDSVGIQTVPLSLNLTVGTMNYKIKVDVKDKAEVAAAERREAELREAMKVKRPEFVLGTSRFSDPKLDDATGDENEADGSGSDSDRE